MKGARQWPWAARRQVWLRLIQARLWDSRRRAWLAPPTYQARFDRLARALVTVREPLSADEAARELGELFRELAVLERCLRERDLVPAPDIEWEQHEAARWLVLAIREAERQAVASGGNGT